MLSTTQGLCVHMIQKPEIKCDLYKVCGRISYPFGKWISEGPKDRAKTCVKKLSLISPKEQVVKNFL